MLTAANTYTGPTNVLGLATPVGNVSNGVAGPFGNVAAASPDSTVIVQMGRALAPTNTSIQSASFAGVLGAEAGASAGFTYHLCDECNRRAAC